MTHQWKFIETPTGRLTFALCLGDRCVKEFDDINLAYAIDKSEKFKISNSIDEFLADSRRFFEDKKAGRRASHTVPRIRSSQFRADQNRIKKEEEKNGQTTSGRNHY